MPTVTFKSAGRLLVIGPLDAAERAAAANLALVGVPDREVLPPETVERWTLRPELARAHFENAFTLVEAEGLR